MSFVKDLLSAAPRRLDNLDVQVFDGTNWVTLNDKLHFRLGARTLSETTQGHNTLSASSTLFDGEWVFHTTKQNVTETIEVHVYGDSWAMIQGAMDALVRAFSQRVYEVRIVIDDYRETWRCFPADYAVDRSHIKLHAKQAGLVFNVPRLPDPVKETLA